MPVSLAQLINEADESFKQAREANEVRYTDILKGYADRKAATLRSLEESQAAESARLAQSYQQASASAAQSTASRGLAFATGAVQQGLASDQQFAEAQLAGAYSPLKKLASIQQDTDRLKAIEDREDQYPDTRFYAQIMEQLGRAKSLSTANLGVGGMPRDIWPANWARLSW